MGVGVGATGVTVGGGETVGNIGSEQALAARSDTAIATESLERKIFSIHQD